MKRLLTFVVLSTLIFSGCSKSNDTPTAATGTIRYTNTSPGGNSYEIFLDGTSLGLLSANKYYEKTGIYMGPHTVKAVQHEGYVLTPTIVTATVSISASVPTSTEFIFP